MKMLSALFVVALALTALPRGYGSNDDLPFVCGPPPEGFTYMKGIDIAAFNDNVDNYCEDTTADLDTPAEIAALCDAPYCVAFTIYKYGDGTPLYCLKSSADPKYQFNTTKDVSSDPSICQGLWIRDASAPKPGPAVVPSAPAPKPGPVPTGPSGDNDPPASCGPVPEGYKYVKGVDYADPNSLSEVCDNVTPGFDSPAALADTCNDPVSDCAAFTLFKYSSGTYIYCFRFPDDLNYPQPVGSISTDPSVCQGVWIKDGVTPTPSPSPTPLPGILWSSFSDNNGKFKMVGPPRRKVIKDNTCAPLKGQTWQPRIATDKRTLEAFYDQEVLGSQATGIAIYIKNLGTPRPAIDSVELVIELERNLFTTVTVYTGHADDDLPCPGEYVIPMPDSIKGVSASDFAHSTIVSVRVNASKKKVSSRNDLLHVAAVGLITIPLF